MDYRIDVYEAEDPHNLPTLFIGVNSDGRWYLYMYVYTMALSKFWIQILRCPLS